MSLCHLLFENNPRWLLAFEKCFERTFMLLVFPGRICRCKDFTAETIPKNTKGLTRISYLFWKWSTERKLRELSSIRSLTFCVIDGRPIIAGNWCVINEFCNRGRDEKMIFWYYSPLKESVRTNFCKFFVKKDLLSLAYKYPSC